MAATFFGHDAMGREVGAQAFYHQALGGAVRLRNQIVLTLRFDCDATLKPRGEQRPGFARDLDRGFEIGRHRAAYEPSSIKYLMSCLKMNRFGAPSRVMRMKDVS